MQHYHCTYVGSILPTVTTPFTFPPLSPINSHERGTRRFSVHPPGHSVVALPSWVVLFFVVTGMKRNRNAREICLEPFLPCSVSHRFFPALNKHMSRRLPTKALFLTFNVSTNTIFTLWNVALSFKCLVFRKCQRQEWLNLCTDCGHLKSSPVP